MNIPEGFVPYEASSFALTFGPVYRSSEESVPVLGLAAMKHHANTMGGVHGGLLLALADTALGNYVKTLIGEGAMALTVDLHATFMVGAHIGQWIEVRPELERRGRTMAFTTASITADAKVIARVSATFFIHHRSSNNEKES